MPIGHAPSIRFDPIQSLISAKNLVDGKTCRALFTFLYSCHKYISLFICLKIAGIFLDSKFYRNFWCFLFSSSLCVVNHFNENHTNKNLHNFERKAKLKTNKFEIRILIPTISLISFFFNLNSKFNNHILDEGRGRVSRGMKIKTENLCP